MIRYKLYQNKNVKSAQYQKWYARTVTDESIDTIGLAEHMASHNSPYSEGVIKGVLTDMIKCIKELVLDGKSVKLDDLAIFSCGMRCSPADSASEFSVSGNVKGYIFVLALLADLLIQTSTRWFSSRNRLSMTLTSRQRSSVER